MWPATDNPPGCMSGQAIRDRPSGWGAVRHPSSIPGWRSLSSHCRAALPGAVSVLLLMQLMQGGCGPSHEYVPFRVSPNDATLRILDDVRLGSADGPDIDRVGVQRAQLTYYDAVWQHRTLDLKQTPVFHRRLRPAFLVSVVVPSVLAAFATVVGLTVGLSAACAAPNCPFWYSGVTR